MVRHTVIPTLQCAVERCVFLVGANPIHSMDWLGLGREARVATEVGELRAYSIQLIARLNSPRIMVAPFKWPFG